MTFNFPVISHHIMGQSGKGICFVTVSLKTFAMKTHRKITRPVQTFFSLTPLCMSCSFCWCAINIDNLPNNWGTCSNLWHRILIELLEKKKNSDYNISSVAKSGPSQPLWSKPRSAVCTNSGVIGPEVKLNPTKPFCKKDNTQCNPLNTTYKNYAIAQVLRKIK